MLLRQELKVLLVRWIAAVLLVLAAAGCTNDPAVVYNSQGFDPPYNYY